MRRWAVLLAGGVAFGLCLGFVLAQAVLAYVDWIEAVR